MVLPPEMIMATIRGDLGALQTFLDQHPERVDDVADEADPMAHRTMSQIAIMCLAAGPSRGVSAPQALHRPAEGALAPPVADRAGQSGRGTVDAATPRPALFAEPAERDRVARARVLEPSLLIE